MDFIKSTIPSSLYNLMNKKQFRVKLVAIAKDEAAYLPEWIFHHLYFGFDAISIYVNNTADNTWELAENLKSEKRVEFLDGDDFFKVESKRSPQNAIYDLEFKKAPDDGYTHMMFLDIDEFYTPRDFNTKISAMLAKFECDVCCLEWALKVREDVPFSPPFQNPIHCLSARQIKSVVSVETEVKQMNPHNVFSSSATYKLANGEILAINDPKLFSLVPEQETKKPRKDFFVLHRILRHEMEYIAALNRGRPIPKSMNTSAFKDNRWGILDSKHAEVITFPDNKLNKYDSRKRAFYNRYNLASTLEKARKSVEHRYNAVLDKIREAPKDEAKVLQKLLRNTTLPETRKAYRSFKRKHGLLNQHQRPESAR